MYLLISIIAVFVATFWPCQSLQQQRHVHLHHQKTRYSILSSSVSNSISPHIEEQTRQQKQWKDKQKPVKNHQSQHRFCDVCGLHFHKILEYEKHLAGKRHQDMLTRTTPLDQLWEEFVTGASEWSQCCNVSMIAPLWKDSELSELGLKYRENTLHPSPVVGKLQPYQRARIWRYIRDALGVNYYNELAAVFAAVDAKNETDGHLRVKELFESIESVKIISRFIIAVNKTTNAIAAPETIVSGELQQTQQIQQTQQTLQQQARRVEGIVDFACGHGIVSLLLAYRFPSLKVYCYDIHKRPTFDAFLRAFETRGHILPGRRKVLENIEFFETDMHNAPPSHIKNSLVISLHGCDPVNSDAINIAYTRQALGWLVMPCCIRKGDYLGRHVNVHLPDDVRYTLLCGAIANKYQAVTIENIDYRISNRNIVLGGLCQGRGRGGL